MSDESGRATHRGRDLSKTMDDLFPQESSRQCRVCNETVVDGRWNYCSERCRDIAQAVHRMFQWGSVRETILERDDYTCQNCGLSKADAKRAYWQTHEHAKEKADSTDEFWEIWRDYGVTEFQIFEVDHIERVADGGHSFDESNLQTLCEPCHEEKTVEENSGRGGPKPSVTLEDYVES